MKTDGLMSSLREMIDAAIEARTAKTETIRERARLHYSRHETVVRETLAQIGALLPRPRLGPQITPAIVESWDKAIDAGLARLRCYECGKRVYLDPKGGTKPHKCGKSRHAIGKKS